MGIVPLVNGVATFTTVALGSGVHDLTATYNAAQASTAAKATKLTTPPVVVVAQKKGTVIPLLVLRNSSKTVVGGRTAACTPAKNVNGKVREGLRRSIQHVAGGGESHLYHHLCRWQQAGLHGQGRQAWERAARVQRGLSTQGGEEGRGAIDRDHHGAGDAAQRHQRGHHDSALHCTALEQSKCRNSSEDALAGGAAGIIRGIEAGTAG